MKLQEMVSRFQAFMSDPNGSLYGFTLACEYLNQAQEEVQNMAVRSSAPFAVRLAKATISANSTGSEEVDLTQLAPGFRRIVTVGKEVSSGDVTPLEFVDLRLTGEFDRLVFNWETQPFYNVRDVYYLRENYLGFYRPSGFTAQIRYEPQVPNLENQDDESIIPAAFHLLVVAKAAELARDIEGLKPLRSLERIIAEQSSLWISFCSRRQIHMPEFTG